MGILLTLQITVSRSDRRFFNNKTIILKISFSISLRMVARNQHLFSTGTPIIRGTLRRLQSRAFTTVRGYHHSTITEHARHDIRNITSRLHNNQISISTLRHGIVACTFLLRHRRTLSDDNTNTSFTRYVRMRLRVTMIAIAKPVVKFFTRRSLISRPHDLQVSQQRPERVRTNRLLLRPLNRQRRVPRHGCVNFRGSLGC